MASDALTNLPAIVAQLQRDVSAMRTELARCREELTAIRLVVEAPEQRLLDFAPAAPEEQLVSLNQMAAIVHRQKDSLRHYRDEMPPPRFNGRRGQKALWCWVEVRPWLQTTFRICLPERFPTMAGAG